MVAKPFGGRVAHGWGPEPTLCSPSCGLGAGLQPHTGRGTFLELIQNVSQASRRPYHGMISLILKS